MVPQSGTFYLQTLTNVYESSGAYVPFLTSSSHSIPHYSLSGNKMSDAGVFFLAGALSVNKSLEKLE